MFWGSISNLMFTLFQLLPMYSPAVVPRDPERLRGLRVGHRSREESVPVDAGRADRLSTAANIHQKVNGIHNNF